ncbi:Gaa1-like protein [Coemansia reversa NRRL 1564]|uniref:Gaa1-like protein n=1 Tax=Coemansia reversa (strain ATCC 12441 / NRRL 1564) TaxID=763665 RepID=A0A2G5B2H4_COERN|nr:Gaa1-like protein [Coemansia reversa NRRL 1564]|eukprot:PIA13219.1 Gaa1-like protein [Coemansia reversa NRRL 1564]
MSFVLSAQGEKTSPALRMARKYSAFLSYPLAVAGIAWLLLLPCSDLFWRPAYFSENAMLPGQVKPQFGSESHLAAMDRMDAALSASLHEGSIGKQRATAVAEVFSEFGLDTEVQEIVYDEVPRVGQHQGTNVHGILRAPRSDSVEALVIAAAWTTADNQTNINAVRLMAALAQYASEQVYWAKDIIFVVTDSGELGMEQWLRAYHGHQTQSPLYVRSGIIQAALSLEFPPAKTYQNMGLYVEGKAGQLPNLDMVNMMQRVSRIEHLPANFHGMVDETRRASMWKKYLRSAQLLLRQVRSQAFGSLVGVHAPFLRYRIDALTLSGIAKDNDPIARMAQQQRELFWVEPVMAPMLAPGTVHSIGRSCERALRSLNNLLEHFHQSFFFYILPANRNYISIGDYIPAAGLMVGSLLLQAMHLWWMQGPSELRSGDPRTRIERINKYYLLLRRTIPNTMGIILRVHLLGLVLLTLPMIVPHTVLTNTTSTAYLFTFALASISMVLHIADTYWAEAARPMVEWRQLKALVQLYVAVTIACLSVMNFSLAVALFAVAGLPLVLTRACEIGSRMQRAVGILLLLLASPVCTMTLGRNVALGLHPLDFTSSPFRMFLADFHHFSSLVYPLVCMIYWPVNLLCMIIVLMP